MAIVARPLSYRDGDTPLSGVLTLDESVAEKRPGILLIHGGAGLDDHARQQACRYAELGYVALAADMYGEGVAGNRDRVLATVTQLRDEPERLVQRGRAGLTALAACPEVDGRLAAIGFCFGGMAALTLARAGEDLAAAVSIHGALKTEKPAEPGSVKAKILALHGALDPHVPMADVVGFAEEMDRAGADWQLTMYGGAMHGFTHEHAVPGATPGVAYDERADRRSFAAVQSFLAEALP
jgi:dienelactone hydrolase